jgi:hypothetical protein
MLAREIYTGVLCAVKIHNGDKLDPEDKISLAKEVEIL